MEVRTPFVHVDRVPVDRTCQSNTLAAAVVDVVVLVQVLVNTVGR